MSQTTTATATGPATDKDVPPTLRAARTTPTALWNDSADPAELAQSIEFGAVGATCNPVIALNTIRRHIDVWGPRLREIAAAEPLFTEAQIGWRAVEEMSIEAARLLEPIFHEQEGRNGRLSVQTDPRLHRDKDALVEQAVHFSELAPNIIVKIPATRIGVEAMEEATYRGVVINATVSFTVPQAMAVAEAIERGLKRREDEGLDTSQMWPVCTIMGGRLDDWLKAQADAEGILIEPGYLDWAGVAALKRAHFLFEERGFRTRILSAAFRNYLQWSELVGGDLVVSPPFEWQVKINANPFDGGSRIDVPVDEKILETLRTRIPDFNRAYEPDGMTPEEFDTFGATRRTLRQFLAADADLDALVRDAILPAI